MNATQSYDDKTALVVVDMQNDFADPEGALSVSGGDAVVELINAEIKAATAAGALVVYTQDWHPPETPHFVAKGGPWPVHCVRDTWGAEFHPELIVVGPSVHKGTGLEDGYSGFSVRHHVTGEVQSTELDGLLRDRDIERVVVVGLALDYCVKATALDAAELGYDTVVPLHATAPVEVEPGDGERAAAALTDAGVKIIAA